MASSRTRGIAAALGWGALGFALPVALLAAVSAWNGVYPFGPESFLVGDLRYQYVDFFTWFRAVLLGDDSLFYSTAQALGSNTWGLYSYYLASPFNLLLPLFDVDQITLFAWVITALKLGCVQLTMTLFLRRRFGLGRGTALALALAFTWSTWTATQLRNPLWLDALILLPLMALGAWALVREGRWRLLLGATTASVIVCWYTAYMSILFVCLYAVFECYLRCVDDPAFGRRGVARTACRFAGVMLGALALAAFMFVPTVLAMTGDVSGQIVGEDVGADMLAKAVKVGVALLVMILVVSAATAAMVAWTHHPSRRRMRVPMMIALALFSLVVLLILVETDVLPVTCTLIQLLSGFVPELWVQEKTPQLSAGSAVLVLVLVFLVSHRTNPRERIAAAVLLLILLASVWMTVLYCVWCGFRAPNGFYSRIGFFVAFTLVWMAARAVQAGCLGRLAEGATRRRVLSGALGVLVAGELLVCAHLAWTQLYGGYPQDYQEAYAADSRAGWDDLRALDGGEYRVAKTYTRALSAALNEGLAAGYMDLSSYSSAHDGAAVRFLNSVGYSQEGQFSVRYSEPIIAMDALLGVKYVWTTEEPAGYEPTGLASPFTGARLWRNPYALPLGYGVVPSAAGFDFSDDQGDPFTRQNAFASALAGREVGLYRPCEAREVAEGTWEVQVPAGCIGYAYVEALPKAGECLVSVDGGAPVAQNARFQQSLHALGGVAEEPATASVSVTCDRDGLVGAPGLPEGAQLIFAALDLDALAGLVGQLGAAPLEVSSFSGAGVAGTCDGGAEGGLVLVTVPADPGWEVRVDGAAVDPVDIAAGALTGVPVGPGASEIEMSYRTPGLAAGCAVTGIAVVALAVILVRGRRRARPDSRGAAEATQVSDEGERSLEEGA
ncbi:MAG: YfhO family protein [Eggerthellaceae bacterium]|nr:YfhO family protein [Eggerthellaceae bacterium]